MLYKIDLMCFGGLPILVTGSFRTIYNLGWMLELIDINEIIKVSWHWHWHWHWHGS